MLSSRNISVLKQSSTYLRPVIGLSAVLAFSSISSSSSSSSHFFNGPPHTKASSFSTSSLVNQQIVVKSHTKQTLASDPDIPLKHNLMTDDKEPYAFSWPHPEFKPEQMHQVQVTHQHPKDLADKIALRTLLFIRSSFDIVTGYKHAPAGKEDDPKYLVTPQKWLQRFVFLESIAGVPGMVGGMVRHLHSLRLLRRDRAWIETLLEEAYNERMHLLTFIRMTKPGWMMRLMLLGAQGVFFNAFFVAYLLMPRICHRFVGYLEEEAVVTYTRCIEDIESGRIPEWTDMPAPDIAKAYWKMKDDAKVLDLLYYVRADESKHREVNHTFGNLVQTQDRNPYAVKVDNGSPQPSVDLSTTNPEGWTREQIAAFKKDE